MSIYEERACDDCGEERFCRRTDCGIVNAWICQDCQQAAQEEVQAAVDAQFDMMCFRLTNKGEEALQTA